MSGLLIAGLVEIHAQEDTLSNRRSRYISTRTDSVKIDSFSIVPNSFLLDMDSSYYTLLPNSGMLVWKKKPKEDSIRIQYRILPFSLSKRFFHKDVRRLDKNILFTPFYYDAVEAAGNTPFVDFGNVQYAGSFGRNLSFGNNQDVVLNSQFNMQMEGDLGDSIRLTGAITDNTLPFQPEGNTQQIQEFDRVFIQLAKRESKLIVGDYDIKPPNSYFMRFYKRVQGGMATHRFYGKNRNTHLTSTAAASFAKGKFSRNVLTALEGNQGPYKLIGPNGEIFFIVLANTERVYIDGVLQYRGEDQDYIIDYNTAEVTFMPRRLITKDLRIAVEFEFTDRNYLNSLFYTNHEFQVNDKVQVYFNAYSNQDARNQSIQQTLDSSQKFFLSQIGDSIQYAFYPSVSTSDSFSNSKIYYKKIDTVVNSTLYSPVYVFSTNPDSAKYILSFTQVGTQKGNYIQAISNANGRVYSWVPPINGVPSGDFEPVYLLVTPKRLQMFTLGSRWQLDSSRNLSAEVALSNSDPNLFSNLHNNTHQGLATRIQYQEKRSIWKEKQLQLETGIQYEHVSRRFRVLERFRNVEFSRDWNIPTNNTFANEDLGRIQFALKKSNTLSIDYAFVTFLRSENFKGFQHIGSVLYAHKGTRVFGKADVVQQESGELRGQFFRPTLEVEKPIGLGKGWIAGSKFLVEDNQLRNLKNDTLLPTAFSFDITNAYIRSGAKYQNTYQLDLIQRRDRAKKENDFAQSTIGHTIGLTGNLTSITNHEIKLNASYRKLQISDTTLTVLKPDETLLGRVDYNFNWFSGLCTGNILYEFGSGQELKREFTYVEVPIGQGTYVWRDYNADGLQQLNEFELAIFPDEKRFIRVFTPTNQYVKAKYSQYNQSISLNPSTRIPSNEKRWYKLMLGKLFFQSAVQLTNRFVGSRGIEQYNPFIQADADSALLQSTTSLVNSIFINRMSAIWGMDYIRTHAGGKTLLNYGIDTRNQREHQFRARFNPNIRTTVSTTYRTGSRDFSSQFLETRNYDISLQSVEPAFTWLNKNSRLRLVTSYKFDQRKNKPWYGNEKAESHSGNFELKYNTPNSGALGVRTTYTQISYNGVANSTLGYTMLDGLLAGKNYIWHAEFNKRVSKNVEMSLEYDGRKSATNPTVHTGRASIRAVF